MVIQLDRPDDPRVALYRGVSDPELLVREGRFIAEGRLVVRRLLANDRFEVESILVTPSARAALADVLDLATADLPVYVVPRDLLLEAAGFNIHRGCLAIAHRPAAAHVSDVLPPHDGPALVVVLESLANADNVGGVFRNAHAFGAAAGLFDAATCAPLYRKAIRTSMGASLSVPFARVDDWPGGLDTLRAAGFTLVALTPRDEATDLANVPFLQHGGVRTLQARTAVRRRMAVLVGNEGTGLSAAAADMADVSVRVPMVPGADSLNAATASGIALHAFARYCGLI